MIAVSRPVWMQPGETWPEKVGRGYLQKLTIVPGVECNTNPNNSQDFNLKPPHVLHSLAMDFLDLTASKPDHVEFDYALIIVRRMSGYIMALPCRKSQCDSRKNDTFLSSEVYLVHRTTKRNIGWAWEIKLHLLLQHLVSPERRRKVSFHGLSTTK